MKQQTADNQHYRLHYLPFWVMWVAVFGVAWLGFFMGAIFFYDLKNDVVLLQQISSWVYVNARWLDGVLIGTGFGVFFAVAQPWLMRWRYGFVPRYWRISSILGGILSGAFFSEWIYGNGYYDGMGGWIQPNLILPVIVWFSALTLVQTLALWPVVRRAWLYPLAGFGAALIALASGGWWVTYSSNILSVLFFGGLSQAVFSGGIFLWLMRDYRVEAVAKRDEKSKGMIRENLHPISFISLWSLAHLFAWVGIFSLAVLYNTLYSVVPYLASIVSWIFSQYWLGSMLTGLALGVIVVTAQPWLMQQYGNYRPRFWRPVGLIAWTVAGLGFSEIIRYNSYYYADNPLWYVGMYLLWFALPAVAQSFVLWRDLRGAWLYALAGIVSGVLAYFLYRQFDWTSSASLYAVIFGAGLQAVLTGTAFVVIMAQNQQNAAEADKAKTVEVTTE